MQALQSIAESIWRAGVQAVDASALVQRHIRLDRTAHTLTVAGQRFSFDELGRICVVGAGKAGAGMAAGVEAALGPQIVAERVEGWVNVPEDCVRPLSRIHLHGARPAGVNEPRPEGVRGTREILRLVSSLNANDLCLVLISGGGSALLPAPIDGVSLEEKTALTRFLSQSGATIQELNAVRRVISKVKGGGLARACTAENLIALMISDVVGDPLEVIASGPTVVEPVDPNVAERVLRKFDPDQTSIAASIWTAVRAASNSFASPTARVTNVVIGNNAVAVEAAAACARALGIGDVRILATDQQGVASDLGRELARECVKVRDEAAASSDLVCLISGGEPVVRLNPSSEPRKGGRNQELVLAAVDELWSDGAMNIALLSGGTDGEDGPTDAAGAVFDAELIARAKAGRVEPGPFLVINNSYAFFEKTGGLLKTGPTHTNVMDLRVAVVRRGSAE
jgi:glycerate-2-kinase